MKAPAIAAALLSLGFAASGALPANAQTDMRGRVVHRPTAAVLVHRLDMQFPTMSPLQLHAFPEQGTLRQIVGPAIVTGVRSGILQFRTQTGVMAGLRMPAARIRMMRLTTGTRVRFIMLNSRQFQLQVTGGRLAPTARCIQKCTRQRPIQ